MTIYNSSNTAVYNAILDHDGRMITAVADMKIFDEITPEYVKKFSDRLRAAPVVVVDANIPADTIEEVRMDDRHDGWCQIDAVEHVGLIGT